MSVTDTVTPEYLKTLKQYYEEEIEGEAHFYALADRLNDRNHKRKMRLMGQVEVYAAAAIAPLLAKHGLTANDAAALRASGQAQAAAASADWDVLITDMRRIFPGYIDDFERLEALAPPQDLARLKVLTAHEVAAIAFLQAESTGIPDSTGTPDSAAPLRAYLRTGRA